MRLPASVFPIMLTVFSLRNQQILSHYYSDNDEREQTLGSAALEAGDVPVVTFCWGGGCAATDHMTSGDHTTASNFKYTLIQPIFHTV